MEFKYLSDVPVLTIDVNEDFKGNDLKSADMIEKVSDIYISPLCLRDLNIPTQLCAEMYRGRPPSWPLYILIVKLDRFMQNNKLDLKI